MDYQIVLRFPAVAINDQAAMLRLESSLTAVLDETEELDGHDFGLDTADLFILSIQPERTFQRIKPVLSRVGLLESVTIASALTESDEYTVLWPEGWPRRAFVR